MTPQAKKGLSNAIRGLRTRLLEDLHDATEKAYRLSVRSQDAGLDERGRARRRRLEEWVKEQVRAQPSGKGRRTEAEFRVEAEKQAAYTLVNRLVILRLMEAVGADGREPMRKPPVVTGGRESRAYKDFRQLAPALVRGDATEGYAFLLQLVFEELAVDLPGVFGAAGVAELVPIPAETLWHAVEVLDAEELASCWADDMTLGWVYQYWNDPEREALDAKIAGGGKIEPHEIASKTQMFTERYMVDWLLQNSLGPMWLAMCKQHGWTADVEGDGTLGRLEARRIAWRAKREAGEVELTALMPLETDAEQRWAYYVPQPIPDDAVEKAPESVRALKVLDPAVGSGHFLVVAMDLLVALYLEEARHRGETWETKWIVEQVMAENLHGIDLDPRAVQIAAASLWLKGQSIAPRCRPERMNLVASNLRLASLPDDDAALVELRREVERETGIPGKLTDTIVHALRGADHLGSLLKVDTALEGALAEHEGEIGRAVPEQGSLYGGFAPRQQRIAMGREEARGVVLARLEGFLEWRTGGDDLGLRLRGEQLAAGVRFLRLVREGVYDLVVANPPYQGTSKLAASEYVEKTYPLGKADLFAAFLLRGLELVREGGTSAMLTMRNWMFIKQFAGLRAELLEKHDLRGLHDLSSGAFESISAAQVVVSVVTSVFRKGPAMEAAVAIRPFDDAMLTQIGETQRKRAATLCHVGRHDFEPAALKVVPERPLVYWWDKELGDFSGYPLLASVHLVAPGVKTGDDPRFTRLWFEVLRGDEPQLIEKSQPERGWQFYVKGAAGAEWIEPTTRVIAWHRSALELSVYGVEVAPGTVRLRDPALYFRIGVAFSPIGASFSARLHRWPSIFGNMGSSVFGGDPGEVLCLLNSTRSRRMLQALNPGIHFEIGDVERLPLRPVERSGAIVQQLAAAFGDTETCREPSIEFRMPGPGYWRYAQEWAQRAVDGAERNALPEYDPAHDPEPPTDHLSFTLGCALGRFSLTGEGILDPSTADLTHALPAGILFLDTTLDPNDHRDSLHHPATTQLHESWTTHAQNIDTKRKDLRTYLALDFFKDVHRTMYENRPIHWPLSSPSKTFVAWVNIHRFSAQTLRILLADHLYATLTRIEGELTDLRTARAGAGADKKAAREAEKRYDAVVKARDELQAFITSVEQCADAGPPPPDPKTSPRDVDARYDPDLDDGVMINSAALWPLLEPQWNDPKKWWKELASAKGKKDYDWSHLAMRYWPDRVDAKCKDDPSLGVAHGCFWKYHPGRAWSWELRLQDEIGPDFRIEEKPYRGDGGDGPHRAAYLAEKPTEALAAIEKEALRRRGRGKDAKPVAELRILEPILWSAHPQDCWDLELRIAQKQGADFHLRAPDEPAARAAFESANPSLVAKRHNFIAELTPPEMFPDDEPEDDAADDTAAEDDADLDDAAT